MRARASLAFLLAMLGGLGVYAVAVSSSTILEPKPSLGPSPLATSPATSAGVSAPKVRLAVLLVFDQLRGDFLERWDALWGPDGFRRLQREGAWFVHCHYPYGVTATGPGHASILTGTCPDRHGIVNNNWYENGENVYCATWPRYRVVPAGMAEEADETERAPTLGKPRPPSAGSPERLLVETVADVLRAEHPRAKIFGLSLKDRSAILPVGRRPDGAFWFTRRFVTSTYYTEQLPAWVEQFHRQGVPERWFHSTWERFRPELDYERWSGPDDQEGEGIGVRVTAKNDPARGWSQGIAFPHPMRPPQRHQPGREYYEALANSPFGNDLLWEFAKACITAEQLGVDDVPDLLAISFSSNDLVGHTWGPDSQEVLDITLRSDQLVAELLRFLDQHVGKGKYLVALTADHGICPLPEVTSRRQIYAQRVDVRRLILQTEAHLTAIYGTPTLPTAQGNPAKQPQEHQLKQQQQQSRWFEAVSLPWLYLNSRLVSATGSSRDEVAREAARFLSRQPEVYRVLTRHDLAAVSADDVIGQRMARSFHPQRCGDLAVVLKPYCLPGSSNLATPSTGTTHGAPFSYDTHVPLLVYGPGITGGIRRERVTPQAIAAIFADQLGIRPPRQAEFPVPRTLYGEVARPADPPRR